MKRRSLRDRVETIVSADWNRRLFDSLIPLPDGTSYNAYLVRGSEKTALLDSADPPFEDALLEQLADVPNVDYVVSHHAEQDHSGAIPAVLAKYPDALLLCTPKAKDLLADHLGVPEARIRTVADNETLSLGDKTLQFLHMPWVHWPETMTTWLAEDKILFSCDFFGSHLSTSNLYAADEPYVEEAAKRYYAEIMMPFRKTIRSHLTRVRELGAEMIAPSHGPVYNRPETILNAYADWVSDRISNTVVLPYISMHGSTQRMADRLADALVAQGVNVALFDLAATDIGKLAIALVDAATIAIGTPTVHVGPHPAVFSATHLANALRPKLKHAAIFGSYGWGTKAVEQIAGLIPNLKVDVLGTVLCKGLPRADDYAALDKLAAVIAERHAKLPQA